MDFQWTEQEQALCEKVAAAVADAPDSGDREAVLGTSKKLAGAGYWDMGVGPSKTGEAMALLAADLEIARRSASLFAALHFTRQFAGLVEALAGDEVKETILAPLRAGELVGAVVADRPLAARAADGGGVTLDGAAPYVADGPIADWFAVRTAVGDAAEVLCLLTPDDPGVTVQPRQALLGLDGLATCALGLEGVQLPAARVLPLPDEGALTWQRRFHDLGMAVAGAGLMQRTFEAAKTYAGEHERDGRAIKKYQAVGFKLAEMLTVTQTAELLCKRAAWMVASGNDDAEAVLYCARVFCSENAEQVASDAIQVLAGAGVVTGNAVEQAFRDAKTLAVVGTSVEKARVAIADELLARY